MSGLICLQGGMEFTPDCREMDEAWLARISPGVTCIAPLACASGVEYRQAANNGAEYLSGLGVTDIIVAPEPVMGLSRAVRAILEAKIVVIPGGSPARVRDRVVGTAIGSAVRAHLAQGGAVVGSSAGAMVLATLMLLPGDDMHVHTGLGAVPNTLVLPHYGEPRTAVVEQVAGQVGDTVNILGIPVCAGVVYDGTHEPFAIGAKASWLVAPNSDPTPIPRL